MEKTHSIHEITRFRLVDLKNIETIQQTKLPLLHNDDTLFLSKVIYTQDDSLSTKLSTYSSSKTFAQCLYEKDTSHSWSLHEIEALLYCNAGSHFDSYFQKWFQKTYNQNIEKSNIEYANAIFVDRHNVNHEKIHFYTPMNQFFSDCHPILQQKLLEMKINTISIQQFIKKGISKKHIIIDNQVIDSRNILLTKEDKAKLTEENQIKVFDDFYSQAIFLYPYNKVKIKNEQLIDYFTCNIIYIPQSDKIIYIDDTDLMQIGFDITPIHYIKEDEAINDIDKHTKYVYSQDYVKGRDANRYIKEKIANKALLNPFSVINEEDEIADVVGQNFFNGAKAYIAQHVDLEDEVTLILDKTNIYDRYAILVLHNGKGVGYVSSKKNLDINFYLLQNKDAKSQIFELDREGKANIKIILRHVKNIKDKELPSIKYEKYIYELPLIVALKRVKQYVNTFEEPAKITDYKYLELMFLSGLYRLYQHVTQQTQRLFQPLMKYTLYQIFGPKSIYDISELIESTKLSSLERDILIYSNGKDNQIGYVWQQFVDMEKNNSEFKTIIILDIYIDYLTNAIDSMIISRKKHAILYDLLQEYIATIKEDLKKLLLQE